MIFKLTRKNQKNYDEYRGFVVRAGSEKEAREFASRRVMSTVLEYLKYSVSLEKEYPYEYEHCMCWLDPEKVVCEAVFPEGETEVILEDFRHG